MAVRPGFHRSLSNELDAATWHFRYYLIREYASAKYPDISDGEIDRLPFDELRRIVNNWFPNNSLLVEWYYDDLDADVSPPASKRQKVDPDGIEAVSNVVPAVYEDETVDHVLLGGAEEAEGVDVEELIETLDSSQYFKLKEISSHTTKKFGLTRKQYDVQISQLPVQFNGEQTLRVMPGVFGAVLEKATEDWNETDRIIFDMTSSNMDINVYITVKKLKDFSVDTIMEKLALVNSQQTLVSDL